MRKQAIATGLSLLLLILSIASPARPALNPGSQRQPELVKMIEAVSAERVRASLIKLESFKTRNLRSSDHPDRGIKASAAWIHSAFEAAGPTLNVFYDTYQLEKQGRMSKEVELINVIAELPGTETDSRERIFLINAHYDSYARAANRNTKTNNSDNYAPGVNDDGSGIAALIEMAHVFSSHRFKATIYFVAFSGEESGLIGSTLLAERLKKAGKRLDGVLTLDMIGNIEGGNGKIDNKAIRIFSPEPRDSLSRQLARYARRTGQLYFPDIRVDLIFRQDRFGRGGDHTPFVLEGWAGIRTMEAVENFSRQHTVNDTLDNMSLEYCTQNIRLITSILGSLALAPAQPSVIGRRGSPQLGRGKSGYDASLRWNEPEGPNELSGYRVYWRETTSPYWQHSRWVEGVNELTLKDLCIDNLIFGVSSVDRAGNESLISAYVMPARSKRTYKVKEK